MAVTSYGAALVAGGGGYVIAAGHLGGQTLIGATQAGGDLTLQDNATNVGGLIHLGSGGVIDRTGATPRFGILTFTPQHALDCPADVAFRGLGTGPLSVVNDVLQVGAAGSGGGSGGSWMENTSGTPAVTVTPDNVTVGVFDANQSEISKLLVNASLADTISALLALAVGGVPLFLVGTDGRVAIGTNILPLSPVVEIRGFPVQFVGQVDHVFEIPSYTQTAGAATGEYLPVKVGGNLRLIPLFAPASSGGPPGTLAITSPTPNQVLSGTTTFQAAATNLPTLASIEWLLDGHPYQFFGPNTVSPYSQSWNTFYKWGGNGTAGIIAVARDASGTILATSARVPFTIQQANNVIPGASGLNSVTIGMITNLSGTLAGTVNFQVNVPVNTTDGQVEAVGYLIDGTMNYPDGTWGMKFNNNTGVCNPLAIDTRQFGDGAHLLSCPAWRNEPANTTNPAQAVAMLTVPITLGNGGVLRYLKSNYRDLFMVPGGASVTLTTTAVNCNGSQAAASGTNYTSDNTGAATVNASTGVVTPVGVGVANITASVLGKSVATRVVVRSAAIMPHFSKTGGILTAYDAAHSVWVRTMHNLDEGVLNANATLSALCHAAGVNAITTPFYQNPVDMGVSDYNSWVAQWQPWWNNKVNTAASVGMLMLLAGDDVARNPAEMNNSISNAYAAQAIQFALAAARDCGRAIAIEMIDESSMQWGNYPFQTSGAWLGMTPSIPDNAFTTLMSIINGVSNRLPITFPVLGDADPATAGRWMGDSTLADYATNFISYQDWRLAYAEFASIPQDRNIVDRVTVGRYPYLNRDRPILLDVRVLGEFYTKLSAGSTYQPGGDYLQEPGVSAVSCALHVLYAAAMGMAGVRLYAYDAAWHTECLNAPIGRDGLQIGANPYETGTDRWQAMASALNLVQRIEVDVLSPQIHAVDLGLPFVTGARQRAGNAGRILIGQNFAEVSETTTVDLTPYTYSGGPAIARYHLIGAHLWIDQVPNGASDTVTFGPGETIVWIFQPSGTVRPQLSITAPLSNATVTGTVTAAVNLAPASGTVVFKVDGTTIATVTSAPYQTSWNTAGLAVNVWHSLQAVATDASGNVSEARIAVRVV